MDKSISSLISIIFSSSNDIETAKNKIISEMSEISELKTELIELKEIEKNQLAASEKSYELQENTYTLTAYIFAALLGFDLVQLIKGVINSIFGG